MVRKFRALSLNLTPTFLQRIEKIVHLVVVDFGVGQPDAVLVVPVDDKFRFVNVRLGKCAKLANDFGQQRFGTGSKWCQVLRGRLLDAVQSSWFELHLGY